MIKFRSFVKKAAVVFVCLLILALLGQAVFNKTFKFPPKIEYGVTFSPTYAQYLGLDWQKTYTKILDDLKVRNLRLTSYWDILEVREGIFDFSQTDYMLNEAGQRRARVILVIGARQPRWPECHIPMWAKNLSTEDRQKKLLQFMTAVLERYKDHPAIWAWQVENEPFLSYFGENCDKADEKFLQTELGLVKAKSQKKIIITDSGELELWALPMKMSDIFGTTLYRRVFNPLVGQVTYPILPYLYNIKSNLVRKIFAPKNQKTIITELQTEPWLKFGDPLESPPQKQTQTFSEEDFKENIEYAQKVGFDEIYLWGVEWWYFMAQNGYPAYLEYAETLYR